MELVCVLFVLAILATIVGLPIASAVGGWQMREIWGSIRVRSERVGDGAFRTAVTEAHRPRGVPLSVWAAGVPGAALAPITGLIFAPAGCLGSFVFLSAPATPALGFVTLAATFDGFLLPFAIYGASRALLRCQLDARSIARRAALWSALHHGVLAVAFTVVLLHGFEGAWCAVVPALGGLVHAGVLLLAGEEVGRIQASMTDEERAEVARILDEQRARDEARRIAL